MKLDVNTLLSKAEGTIPPQAFTGEHNGLFSKKYLADESVYERLQDGEAIHHLLVNRTKGLKVEQKESSASEVLSSDKHYCTVAAITDKRVFFVVGRKDGDHFIEIEAENLSDARLKTGFLKTKITLETTSEIYTFNVRKRESSNPDDAVGFVQDHLLPAQHAVTSPDESTKKEQTKETVQTETEFWNEGLELKITNNNGKLSDSSKRTIQNISETILSVDPSDDPLNDVIAKLQTTKRQLSEIKSEPAVSTKQVEMIIDRIDSKLNPLLEIQSIYFEAKRKLLIHDKSKGREITNSTFKELQSSLDDAIELAEKLDRSSEKLTIERKRIINRINANKSASSVADRSAPEIEASSTEEIDSGHRMPQAKMGNPKKDSDPGEENNINATNGIFSDSELESDNRTKSSPDKPTRDELIAELRRVKTKIGKTPTPIYIRQHSQYTTKEFINEFDGLIPALEAMDAAEKSDQAGDQGASTDGDPNREDIIKEIERISEKLEKRPTTTEFNEHSRYSTSDMYSVFDSWEDAIDAAAIEYLSREKLLDELRRLEAELGYPPLSSDIDTYSKFSTYDFQQEFGSIDNAIQEAGFDVEAQIKEILRKVVADKDEPKMADLGADIPYSESVIYKYFDSWDDAVATVSPERNEDSPGSSSATDSFEAATENSPIIEQNELSERYETLRNLRELCTAVVEVRDSDESTDEKEDRPFDPMTQWVEELEIQLTNDGNYGAQQRDRNPFSMTEYRNEFGNGDRVTEFTHIRAQPPTRSIQTLLSRVLDVDTNKFYLPVDPKTKGTFPVIVESNHELELAVEMLRRLPEKPDATDTHDQRIDIDEDETSTPDTDTKTTGTDLSAVSGVTESIARSLKEAGYSSRDDLKDASMDDLAAVDDVSQQIAMRIKLDVGG